MFRTNGYPTWDRIRRVAKSGSITIYYYRRETNYFRTICAYITLVQQLITR